MDKQNSYSYPLPKVFLVMFVLLKLTNYIDWSWWWILSPLWIMFISELILHINKK